MYLLKKYFLIILLSPLFFGCSQEAEKSPSIKIPPSVAKNFEYKGKLDSNVVLIFNQGGPTFELNTEQFPYEPLLGAPIDDLKNALVVYMHQYQTKHQDVFVSRDITFNEAKEYDEQTTKMLAETVDYFHKTGKKVYLIGFSFGTFVVQNYLAQYDTSKISGVILGVGRLNMPEEFWQAFSQGKELFYKNGIEIIQDQEKESHSSDPYSQKNSLILAGALGAKNYLELLKTVDLPKTIYIYGENDSYVGRLTSNEVDFLKSKGVAVAKSEGGHEEAINQFIQQALMRMVSH